MGGILKAFQGISTVEARKSVAYQELYNSLEVNIINLTKQKRWKAVDTYQTSGR